MFFLFLLLSIMNPLSMKRLFIFLLLWFFLCELFAQAIAVSDISTLGQLPVNAIHRVFQDSEGYMWYGTVDGLCRDDGYRVQVFRADINTPKLLADNSVTCITEDSRGRIWFGADRGAYILDKTDYRITPLDEARLKNKLIEKIYATSDSCLWISYQGILAKYNIHGECLKEYPIRNAQGDSHVSGFCESRNREIFITIEHEAIFRYDSIHDKFSPCKGILRKHTNFCQISQDKEHDYFWVGTWNHGLVRFSPAAQVDSVYTYFPLPRNTEGKPNGIVYNHIQDNVYGYLWGVTDSEIVVFAPQPDGTLRQIFDYKGLLPGNSMLSEIFSGNGCLWIAAFDRNSFLIHLTGNSIQSHKLPALHKRCRWAPAVMAICEAGDDIMWMMQERYGLVLYDLRKDRISTHTDFAEMASAHLTTGRELTVAHHAGGVWAVRDKSRIVYRVYRNNMTMRLGETIDLNGLVPPTTFITKLYEDNYGCLWIGLSEGLCRYDVKTHKVIHVYSEAGHVTGIVENREEGILICTKNGILYHYNADGSLYSLITDGVPYTCLTLAPNGLIWLGSDEGGIYAYDPIAEHLTNYSGICGMNGDQVNQIVADDYNHIWIDTNRKLTEFNPRNNSFRTFQTTDGSLLLNRFLPTAMCRMADGRICFGGIPGLCIVTPSNSLDLPMNNVKTYITDIRLQDRSLLFNRRDTRDSDRSITLYPNDRNIKISFSSLNHRYASKVRYAYRLLNIDSDWNYMASGENTAFYNYLPKGTYTFQVRATDENGLWSRNVTNFTIHRLPAFYETWWAYLLYLLSVLSLIGYLLFLYLRRVEKKNNEMWGDSKELMRMRTYLDSPVNLPEPEYIQLDKLLLEKITKAVEANLMEPEFNVNALAAAVYMSRSTLTRKLKAITGYTPLEFIRHIKMQHARRLLEDKDRSISEVAATLGYFNRKYFTICFKEEFGITPSEFQKNSEA